AQPVFYVGTGEDVRGALHDYIARYCGWGAPGATED
ncbi:MAG: hypothetical protein JWP95_1250, partial [Actinotalea sp.]|nr:hypothetical protein [Actinotalea sp.]